MVPVVLHDFIQLGHPPAVFRRRDAGLLLERFGKILTAGIAAIESDVRNGSVRISQQLARLFEPDALEILRRGIASQLFGDVGELRSLHAALARHFIQGPGMVE